jgi:hypothetical protein
VDERFGELEAEIERVDALRHAYDPDDIARGGVFVVLNHDGMARIERGFIRAEDEKPETEANANREGYTITEDGEIIDGDEGRTSTIDTEDEDTDDDKPLSDLLIRDLTAHRTLAPASRSWQAAGHGVDRRRPCAGRSDLLSGSGSALPRYSSHERTSWRARGRHRGHSGGQGAGGSSCGMGGGHAA